MKTLYLVRHGHVDNPDHVFYDEHFPLSDVGKREASELAQDFTQANCRPKRILSSPYLRARETAQIISALNGPDVEYDDRLKEWQVDGWFLKPLKDFRVFAGYDKTPFVPNTDGIEDFETMSARVVEIVQEVAGSIADGECALLVSHREPMVSAILRFEGKGWDHVPLLDFPKGSAWKLTFDGDAFVSAEKAFDRASAESRNGI